MRFKFAKATNITSFAKKKLPDMYKEYEKIYICPDVKDYHILRILKGFGEDYEPDKNKVILEHQMISKSKEDAINSLARLESILQEDDGGNWDYFVKDNVDQCIEVIDGGFGII